jgi:hypothetical protein
MRAGTDLSQGVAAVNVTRNGLEALPCLVPRYFV